MAGEINVFGTKENYGEALKCTLSLGLESFIEWGLSKFIDGGEEEPKEVKTREEYAEDIKTHDKKIEKSIKGEDVDETQIEDQSTKGFL